MTAPVVWAWWGRFPSPKRVPAPAPIIEKHNFINLNNVSNLCAIAPGNGGVPDAWRRRSPYCAACARGRLGRTYRPAASGGVCMGGEGSSRP